MIVLSEASPEWTVPWWAWLVVGVVLLMLLVCLVRWALGAAGVETEDRSVRYAGFSHSLINLNLRELSQTQVGFIFVVICHILG
jgi:hypothetical protein